MKDAVGRGVYAVMQIFTSHPAKVVQMCLP